LAWMRRGEFCGLRWCDVDLDAGVVALSRSIGQRNVQTWDKVTETHHYRRIALDPETVEILLEHRHHCIERAGALGIALGRDAFVFSLVSRDSIGITWRCCPAAS